MSTTIDDRKSPERWRLKKQRCHYPLQPALNRWVRDEVSGILYEPPAVDEIVRVLDGKLFLNGERAGFISDDLADAIRGELMAIQRTGYQLDAEAREETELRMDPQGDFWFHHQ